MHIHLRGPLYGSPQLTLFGLPTAASGWPLASGNLYLTSLRLLLWGLYTVASWSPNCGSLCVASLRQPPHGLLPLLLVTSIRQPLCDFPVAASLWPPYAGLRVTSLRQPFCILPTAACGVLTKPASVCPPYGSLLVAFLQPPVCGHPTAASVRPPYGSLRMAFLTAASGWTSGGRVWGLVFANICPY